jgi:outer membrane lipoprotein-sorting protein
MQALASVPARRAQFVEVKSIAALSQPINTTGTLVYRRPSYLAKIAAPPHAEQLVVDGQRLWLTEGDQPSHVIDLDSRPQLRALVDAIRGTLSGDLALLQRSYHVAMTGKLAAWHLTLTPSDPAVASLLRFIVIDGTGATPHMIRTVQANGDESRMTINPQP